MRVGFYTVFRRDPIHLLHATALVASIKQVMPTVEIHHFTDDDTAAVEGVTDVRRLPDGPMLERRLEHYSHCEGEWLFLDTDTLVLQDVRTVLFDHPSIDLALADRAWPHLPQGDEVMHSMPFNTGVCFSRSSCFWQDVLTTWRSYDSNRRDWMSEQRAVYEVVRTGRYRVKILPGMIYNYPPRTPDDPLRDVAIAHFKGPRKQWLTERIERQWREAPVCASV